MQRFLLLLCVSREKRREEKRREEKRREEKRREERALFFGWCVDIFLPRFGYSTRWIKESKSLFCSSSRPEKVKNFERWRCNKTEGGGRKEFLKKKGGERQKSPSETPSKKKNGITIIDGNSTKNVSQFERWSDDSHAIKCSCDVENTREENTKVNPIARFIERDRG